MPRTPSQIPLPGEGKSGAETARKVLQILMGFSETRPTATVRELAEQLGLSLPTTHRYVALLRELGFLDESEGGGRYQLGWRVLQLAQAARSATGLIQVAQPIMARLAASTGETVTLLRVSDLSMECIAQEEADQILRLSLYTGQRLPLTAGASARALLAQIPRERRETLLERLARDDPGFSARRRRFTTAIEHATEEGVAVSFEEIDPGIWAVAVPVGVEPSTPTCLSVAGPATRLEQSDRERVIGQVRRAADEINTALAAQDGTAARQRVSRSA